LKNVDKNRQGSSEDEPKFILWKTELNKELLSFWESMAEPDQE